jgi:hypothetical protein
MQDLDLGFCLIKQDKDRDNVWFLVWFGFWFLVWFLFWFGFWFGLVSQPSNQTRQTSQLHKLQI